MTWMDRLQKIEKNGKRRYYETLAARQAYEAEEPVKKTDTRHLTAEQIAECRLRAFGSIQAVIHEAIPDSIPESVLAGIGDFTADLWMALHIGTQKPKKGLIIKGGGCIASNLMRCLFAGSNRLLRDYFRILYADDIMAEYREDEKGNVPGRMRWQEGADNGVIIFDFGREPAGAKAYGKDISMSDYLRFRRQVLESKGNLTVILTELNGNEIAQKYGDEGAGEIRMMCAPIKWN